jgi:two-component system chemotaxis response regulator CheB
MAASRTPISPIRVLVVDDSAFMRLSITNHLNETPGITVVGSGKDGAEALELIPKLNPDVITLDVEMPRLDGMSALREIMSRFPRPVVMLSSLTKEGAAETVQALTLGAVDFVAKPGNKASIASIMDEVATKIIQAAKARVHPLSKTAALSQHRRPETKPTAERTKKKVRALNAYDHIVVIGTSTGGPRALNTVVPSLPANLPAALLIVQHMPEGFTRSLAERLDSQSAFKVKEAESGDIPQVGLGLVAPGGFHMVFDRDKKVVLNQNPPVHGVRPAVDVTLFSVSKHFGDKIITVILTGMGNDGANGSALIHSSGGWIIAEAEETSVVWGMPRSVIEAGVASEIIRLPDIATAIKEATKR